MALNQKNSRKIVVEENAYRYTVSATRPDADWNFHLNVSLQSEAGGARLVVRGLVPRDFWLDISKPGVKTEEDYPIVTPRHIRKIIALAIADGWQPQKTGPSFELELKNERLFFQQD